MIYTQPNYPNKEFSEKHKAVFVAYCQRIRSYGKYANLVKKEVLYKEVADALFYRNWGSVAHIIRVMLKEGYAVNLDGVEENESKEQIDNIARIKDEIKA